MVLQKRQLERAFSPKKIRNLDRNRTARINTNASQQSTNDRTFSKIKVVVRVRPKNSMEMGEQYKNAVDVIDDKMLIFDPKEKFDNFFFQGVKQKGRDMSRKINKNMSFMFDNVFGNNSTNRELFECCTKDLLSSLMSGFNCSVFVYGATGAGKTHTMLGNESNPGITFLTMVELFNQIDTLTDDRSFDLGITYVEVYNETVRNLLNPSGPLHLREDNELGVIVSGVEITRIYSAAELLALLTAGNKNRTQHPTDANAESSRSHAVFQVHVRMVSRASGQVKQVKLSMIDLAGSERGSATGCSGVRFKEGANINKSLLALGNCINSLADGQKHIPYRDSKLTRLLKDSLGGNCQTVMIANISPSSLSYEDTYNTLKYASRAKNIKTTIKKNIVSCDQHVGHYVQRVKDLTAEIEKLKMKLKVYESQGRVAVIKPSATVPAPVPSVDAEKNIIPTPNNEVLKDLRCKLASLFKNNSSTQKLLLLLQSQEKALNWRMKMKEEMCDRVKNIMLDDEHTHQNKLQISINQFGRQSEGISQRLRDTWEKHSEIEKSLKNVLLEVKTGNFDTHLYDYISYEIEKLNLEAAKSQNQHTQKLFELCRYEMMDLHKVAMQQSSLLKQYYFLLKSCHTQIHDFSIISNGYALIEKQIAGGNKCISWDNKDASDPEINMAFLSLDLVTISSDVLPAVQNVSPEDIQTDSEEKKNNIETEQLALCLRKLEDVSKKFEIKQALNLNNDKKPCADTLNQTITLDSEASDLAAPLDVTHDLDVNTPIKLQPVQNYEFKKPKNLHDNLFSANDKKKTFLSSNLEKTFVLKENEIKRFGENTKTKFKKPLNNENTTALRKAGGHKSSWKTTPPKRSPLARKVTPSMFKTNKENKQLPGATSPRTSSTNSSKALVGLNKGAQDLKRIKDKRAQSSHPYLRPHAVASTAAIRKQAKKE